MVGRLVGLPDAGQTNMIDYTDPHVTHMDQNVHNKRCDGISMQPSLKIAISLKRKRVYPTAGEGLRF